MIFSHYEVRDSPGKCQEIDHDALEKDRALDVPSWFWSVYTLPHCDDPAYFVSIVKSDCGSYISQTPLCDWHFYMDREDPWRSGSAAS